MFFLFRDFFYLKELLFKSRGSGEIVLLKSMFGRAIVEAISVDLQDIRRN